jgi:hypothetical protein
LGSSVNPEQLSLMIKGGLGFIAIILVGFGVSQVELNVLIDQIVNLVLIVSQAIALCFTIWGGVRKIINHFSS